MRLAQIKGASHQERIRAFVEIPRRHPRHGTTRTLSVLAIGILGLSLPRFTKQAFREILTKISL